MFVSWKTIVASFLATLALFTWLVPLMLPLAWNDRMTLTGASPAVAASSRSPLVGNRSVELTGASPATATSSSRSESPAPHPRVLLYITTHMSADHRSFLETCWPVALRHVALLREATVMVFNSGNDSYTELLQKTFPGQELVIHHSPVVRENADMQKQLGANLAMQVAFEKGWFKEYDWVIRVNPDVIVRHGEVLLALMEDPHVDGIFIDCNGRKCSKHCYGANVQTDFTAFRTSAVCANSCVGVWHQQRMTSEDRMTQIVMPIIRKGRDRYLSDKQGQMATWPGGQKVCKASTREGSPVAHWHHYERKDTHSARTCVEWFEKNST